MKKTVRWGLFSGLLFLLFSSPSVAQISETIVLTGESASGTNLTFDSFSQAWSDEEGLVVFEGILSDGTRGIWYHDNGNVFEVVREGQVLPGTSDVLPTGFVVIGVEQGSFAFYAYTDDGGALVVGDRTGASTVAYGGMTAPGTGDLFYSNIDVFPSNGSWSYAFNNGNIAFTALVRNEDGSKGQNGIWLSSGGGTPSMIALSEGDQFDEIDEWPEVPGVVFEFRDVHISESGEVFFRANATPPVRQYVFKSSGGGRTLVDLGGEWNPSVIRLGKDGRLAVAAVNGFDQTVLIESAAGSGTFETVMSSGDIPTDENGNPLATDPWLYFASSGMGFDESGQLYIDANVDAPIPTSGVWVRRANGSVELALEGGFVPNAAFGDPTPLGMNNVGDLAIGHDFALWFQASGGSPTRIAGRDDTISVAPGDNRVIDIIVLGTTYFSSPGYGGRSSAISNEQSIVAVTRFEDNDDTYAILRFSGLEGGLIINATSDAEDTNPGDGVCNTGGTVSGEAECTLRAAIQEANATSEEDNISFAIPGSAPYAITVQSPLPAVINPINLTGPAYEDLPAILLDGVAAGEGAAGLLLESGATGSSIKNLWILAFKGPGVVVNGNDVSISECVLGLDGSQLTGNGTGVQINGDENMVSTSLISGNSGDGIDVTGDENRLLDNVVGLNKAGDTDLGNGASGIKLSGDQNLVEDNLISRNANHGINIAAGDGNEIYKNYIGTDITGRNRLGNVDSGVFVEAATNSVIGNTGEGNILSGNLGNGVHLKGPSTGSLVLGNFIGVDPSGEIGPFNINAGVFIDGSSNNEIGAVSPETGNVIRDNEYGIVVTGAGMGNRIRYNLLEENRKLDIDLNADEKVTANDLDPSGSGADADTGPNSLMNFPVGILRSIDLNQDILVSGMLDTVDPASSTIDLYGVNEPHESGVGGGHEWLGSLSPDSTGQFVFIINPSVPYKMFSATATDADGSTSEFSPVCDDPDGDGNPDSDGDGLCDMWEIDGIDYDMDGVVDLKYEGAFAGNAMRKDIYVEVDWMAVSTGTPHNHEPLQSSLDQVKNAFSRSPVQNPDGTKGIRLHFIKDAATPEITPIRMNADAVEAAPAGTFNDIKYGKPVNPCGTGEGGGHFGTAAERASESCPAILGARRLASRYLLFGHDHAHQPGSSGIAELPGNDFMVTLGSWSRTEILATGGESDGSSASFIRAKTGVEAGTIMHEMGHTLNLMHGGIDDYNCKPNYISIMNYSLQFPYLVPGRPLDYSSKTLPDLNETSLNENMGLSGKVGELFLFNTASDAGVAADQLLYSSANASSIDWNADGSFDNNQPADIDYIPLAGCTWQPTLRTLKSQDDWSKLLYNFRTTSDFGDGSTRAIPSSFEPENTPEITLNAAMSFDFDDDGLVNALDNCAVIANADQADLDQDGIGDVCEMGQADLSLIAENRNRTDDVSAPEQLQFFQLTVHNAGPDSAFAVTLSDTLFFETTLNAVTSENGSCITSGSVLICTNEGLAPGDSMVVTYQATLENQTQVSRWASVNGEALDPDTNNNQVMGTLLVANESDDLPAEIRLFQNFPNPFNQVTSIAFELPSPQEVQLVVYDMLGRAVLRAFDAMAPAGHHEVRIYGEALASGIYVYKLEAGGYSEIKQMVVIR